MARAGRRGRWCGPTELRYARGNDDLELDTSTMAPLEAGRRIARTLEHGRHLTAFARLRVLSAHANRTAAVEYTRRSVSIPV